MSIVLSLLFLAALASFGVAFFRRTARSFLTPLEIVAYGAPAGIVAGSFVLLLLSLAFGLGPMVVAETGTLCVAAAMLLVFGARLRQPKLDGDRRPLGALRGLPRATANWLLCRVGLFPALVLGGLIALWALFYAQAIEVRADGLWTIQQHIWSDVSVHLAQITAFAYGDNFPPENPFYAGEPLVYHYLISLTTAALVELGMSPWGALSLHDLVLSAMVTLALFALARRLTGSRDAAALAVLLFLLGSGLGWLLTAAEVNRSHDLLGTLRERAWDYQGATEANIRWEPVFIVALAPTRGSLYGFALGAAVIGLLFVAVRGGGWRPFLLAGLIAGMLPLAHNATLLSLALVTPFLFLLFPSRRWFLFFGTWALLAAPQLLLQGGASGGSSRIHQDFGWMAEKDNAVWFWLTNLGLFLPLGLLAFLERNAAQPGLRRFLLAFMPLFVIGNLWAFDPTGPWNNVKLFVYWFLAVCVLVAALIVRAWREQRTPLVRSLLAGAVATMLLSGLLMHLHTALGKDRYQLFSRAELDLAARMRQETAPDAVLVSGVQHNPALTTLSGRRGLIFFPPYLVSWGIDPAERERDIRSILLFTPETPALLAKYGADYVAIGPWERGMGANLPAWQTAYPVAFAEGDYVVFDVRGPAADVPASLATAAAPGSYPQRSEGECVRALSGGDTYFLQGGARRAVPDESTRLSLGCTAVWPWGDAEIARIPVGQPVPAAR